MRNQYDKQQINMQPLSPAQRIGADIKLAKLIYEKMNNVDADDEDMDVNKWLREANALKKRLKLNTLQQVFEELIEVPYKIEI